MTDEEYYNLKVGQKLLYTPRGDFPVFVSQLSPRPGFHKFIYRLPHQNIEGFAFIYPDLLAFPEKVDQEEKKDTRFPHICPRCKAPAYIGFQFIECQKKCEYLF